MNLPKYTNSLIHEKSPYLLQHAHNPVNWLPWNDAALEKAAKEDKLIIVSIGYSACHWCHVMEHESFEDEQVAQIMNDTFICVKVDREERPDIDQVYMSAVQIMTGHGGWPLNCITLPDGKPLYGGTYFQKPQWINILTNLAEIWKNNRTKALEYAEELTKGLRQVERLEVNDQGKNFLFDMLVQGVGKWKSSFDFEAGGFGHAPKFPMPNNYIFLLRYSRLANNLDHEKFVFNSLRAMATGGIYDQIGGGFARYSTDGDWKVPHFEKMLYDNAQLVSLYFEAYRASKEETFRKVAAETIEFVERELACPSGGFYSALDADSEGEEGKFYVWQIEELRALIPEKDFELFSELFSVNENGYWEDGKYILLGSTNCRETSLKYTLKIEELIKNIEEWKALLLNYRNKRNRPGLDDKILASWNAMMIRAYSDAYTATGNEKYKLKALSTMDYFIHVFEKPEGGLYHSRKNNESYINGFLEDYAFAIDAALAVYLIDTKQKWLDFAITQMNFAFDKFYDDVSGMFYFTSSDNKELIVRKFDLNDNVIPSSNSVMARDLFTLFRITGNSHYRLCSERMLNNVKHELVPFISGYSNWAILLSEITSVSYDVLITGPHAEQKYIEFSKEYVPGVLTSFTETAINSGVFKGKFSEGKTCFYVCRNQTCEFPVETVEEVMAFIH